MYSGINSVPPLDAVTPVGAQPYASPQASIYFIVYMTLMTFVLLQLFIGVVIVAFQAVGVKSFRETKLDRNQVLYNTLNQRSMDRNFSKFLFLISSSFNLHTRVFLYVTIKKLEVHGLGTIAITQLHACICKLIFFSYNIL